MRVSVITVCLNALDTIQYTLDSVARQQDVEVEHIVIDGGSSDGTIELIKATGAQVAHLVSEPDDGIYDAMNKGLALATGEVVGLLNADDVLAHDRVLAQVALAVEPASIDGCYADLVYVDQKSATNILRYWRSNKYDEGSARFGWMPPHPTIYLKKSSLALVKKYRTDIGPQADLEYCARLFEKHRLSMRYVPEVWVNMRAGGITNYRLIDILRGNWRSYLALRELGLAPNPVHFFVKKILFRIPTFFNINSAKLGEP